MERSWAPTGRHGSLCSSSACEGNKDSWLCHQNSEDAVILQINNGLERQGDEKEPIKVEQITKP